MRLEGRKKFEPQRKPSDSHEDYHSKTHHLICIRACQICSAMGVSSLLVYTLKFCHCTKQLHSSSQSSLLSSFKMLSLYISTLPELKPKPSS